MAPDILDSLNLTFVTQIKTTQNYIVYFKHWTSLRKICFPQWLLHRFLFKNVKKREICFSWVFESLHIDYEILKNSVNGFFPPSLPSFPPSLPLFLSSLLPSFPSSFHFLFFSNILVNYHHCFLANSSLHLKLVILLPSVSLIAGITELWQEATCSQSAVREMDDIFI